MRISQPDPRRPANASGTWPYDAPKPVPGHADPGNGTPASDDQPYEDAPADAAPDDSGGWSLPQKYVPPPDWHGEDTYVPRNDDGQPPWDGSSRPTPCGPPVYQRKRQFPGRLTAAAALLLAAIAVAVFARDSAIRVSPAGNPRARAGQHELSMKTGTRPGATASPAVQPPATTKGETQRVASACLRVSNAASAHRSGSPLRTIEGGTRGPAARKRASVAHRDRRQRARRSVSPAGDAAGLSIALR